MLCFLLVGARVGGGDGGTLGRILLEILLARAGATSRSHRSNYRADAEPARPNTRTYLFTHTST